MTTNTHILTIDTHLGQLRELVRSLPESTEKQGIMEHLLAITDEVFSAQSDFAIIAAQVTDLTKQLYAPVVTAQSGTMCRYIDLDALNKGAYSLEEFDKMLCQACESEAKVLGAFLRKYEKIGYLDFHGESKKKIQQHLRECYPTMRRYGYSNFSANF